MVNLREVIPLMPLLPTLLSHKFIIKIGPVDVQPLYGKLIDVHRVVSNYLIELDVVVVPWVLI